MVALPYLVWKTIGVDVDKIVFLRIFRGYNAKSCGETAGGLIDLFFLNFAKSLVSATTCTYIIRETLTTLNTIKFPVYRLGKGIAQI